MKPQLLNKQTRREAGSFLKIDEKALEENMAFLKKDLKADTLVMAMVKAVAYGHGAVLLARILEEKKWVHYFGVASVEKGIELRENGIELPIMVTNPLSSGFDKMVDHCLEPVLHNLELAENFSDFLTKSKQEDYPIHLKFNTGMNRFGIDVKDCPQALNLALKAKWRLKSIMSHLSCSDDEAEDAFTYGQFEKFEGIKKVFQKDFPSPIIYHILNSNGTIRFPEHQEGMVRIGIGLYGATEYLPARKLLKPIASFYCKITQIRKVQKGESISYSRSGRASKTGYIGTITVGYADGFPRALGNGKWKVQIKDKLYPIIGNVCMDYCMIDLGESLADINLEDEVLIFGGKKDIYDFAEAQGTICYEAMTNLGNRVQRLLIEPQPDS